MSEADGPKLQFKPRARIIRTIGDQLINGPEAAIIELVKNAYDADASFVSIKFFPPLKPGLGRIVITDDGHGMSLADIESKWMEPAFSAKRSDRTSPKKRRPMMGSKGIGRFAAAKLGRMMSLLSTTASDNGGREVLVPLIDWSVFEGDGYLESVRIGYETHASVGPTGTEIEVRELTEAWSEPKMRRLFTELRRLVSPLGKDAATDDFRIYLDLSECKRANGDGVDGDAILGPPPAAEELQTDPRARYRIRPIPVLSSADYEVSGKFKPSGEFTGTFQIRRGGVEPIQIDLPPPKNPGNDQCGEVGVRLFIFDREEEALVRNFAGLGVEGLDGKAARRLLDDISGIAIYRDGFRIRPYGDPTNDWLTLDTRRVQNPSLRIGHNQVSGFVTIEGQGSGHLVERSSREGLEENGAYQRLRILLLNLLASTIEPKRQKFRDDTGLSRPKRGTFRELRELSALPGVQSLISQLPKGAQAAAVATIAKESAKLTERITALEERQRVLEAQSSLGAIVSEILHEGVTPANYLHATATRLRGLFPHLTQGGARADEARDEFPGKLAMMEENAAKLTGLFGSLQPLAGGRRTKPKLFRPPDVAAKARSIFSTRGVTIELHGGAEAPRVMGHPEDLSTALVNLFMNSVHWLEYSETEEPRIDVWFEVADGNLSIFVDDNGPGIPPDFVERVFDVGFTLKEGGTGLGLNIAREALDRSTAKLLYHPGAPVGARFEIQFKLPEIRE